MKILMSMIHVKKEILILFDGMIVHIFSYKKFQLMVADISFAYIPQYYFLIASSMYLYVASSMFGFAYYFIVKVSNKRELQQIANNFSSDIVFKSFMKLYQKNITHASDIP